MTDPEHCESAPNTTRLFVYGTLRPGQVNYPRIEKFVISHQPGTIEGELLNLGAFPGLVSGDGIVEGDLLEIRPEALGVTDGIEGFRPGRETNFYERREVLVTLADGSTEAAWTYFYAANRQSSQYEQLLVGVRGSRPVFVWGRKRRCISNPETR